LIQNNFISHVTTALDTA